MARSNRAPEAAINDPGAAISAEDEAQFEQMRADDAAEPAVQAPEPAPREDAAPEPTEPAEAAPARKMVPLEALHEERERRKQLDTMLAEERQRMRTLEERTNLLLQRQFAAQQQPAPEPPKLPDVATDPVGHIVQKLEQTERELANVRQIEAQRQQQLGAIQQIQQIEQRARALESQFSTEHPDYADAVQHIFRARNEELRISGYLDPVERQNQIQQEALALAANSMQRGQNPAEVLYGLARQRGYQPASTEPQEAAQEAPAAAAGQRIERIAAGQQQARSLSNTRGSGPAPMNAQRLLAMTDDEFVAAMATPAGRDLMGA